jgi:hypothetical protein
MTRQQRAMFKALAECPFVPVGHDWQFIQNYLPIANMKRGRRIDKYTERRLHYLVWMFRQRLTRNGYGDLVKAAVKAYESDTGEY